MNFQDYLKWFLDLIYPVYCLGCGKEKEYVCSECFGFIERQLIQKCPFCRIASPLGKLCPACQKKYALNTIIVAVSREDKFLKQLIYEYKYRFIKNLSRPLARLIIEALERENFPAGKYIAVPVPLSPKREKWRGFNQSDLLAKEIAGHFKIPRHPLLERRKNKTPQMEIKNREERIANVRHVIGINPLLTETIKSKNILLIDDISTTGATLNECALALKQAGARNVSAAVLLKN